MASIILSFLTPGIIFLGTLFIVVVAIILLAAIERRLNRKIIKKKIEKENYFKLRLENLEELKSNPEKFIISLNELARDIFAEKFKIDRDAKYSDLFAILKKQSGEAAIFCRKMQEALYAGDKLDEKKLEILFSYVKDIAYSKPEEVKKLIPREMKQEDKKLAFEDIKKAPQKQISTEKEIRESKEDFSNEEYFGEELILKKPMKEENKLRNKETILRYLTEGFKRGFRVEQLKNKLLESEFNENDINDVVAIIKSEQSKKEKISIKIPAFTSITKNKTEKYGKNAQAEIIKYLRDGTERGNSLDVLKQKLFAQGFSEEDVNKAIGYLNLEGRKEEKKEKAAQEIKKGQEAEKEKVLEDKKQEDSKAKKIITVPYKEEKIKIKKIKYPEKEPEPYKLISSIDNLDRLKEKIIAARKIRQVGLV